MKKLATILLIATCAFANAKAELTDQGSKPVTCGNSVTVTAAPINQYYELLGFTDIEGGTTPNLTLDQGTTNQVTITPTGDVTITALFKQKKFVVTYALTQDAEDKGVTIKTPETDNQSIDTIHALAGDNYTFDQTKYNVPTGICLSITGYHVEIDDLNQDGTTTHRSFDVTNLNDANAHIFQLKGNATITPILTQGSYTVTIKSDTSMGTVSFVNQNNSGSTSGGSSSDPDNGSGSN